MLRPLALVALLLVAGCATPAADVDPASAGGAAASYQVPEPDLSLALLEEAFLVPMPVGSGVLIHTRIVRPDVAEPVPVVVEFTPYNGAPSRAGALEPQVFGPGSDALGEHYLVTELGRRGFAVAFADVRGTADSSGCLDLRGALDVEDARALTDWLGTQPWSNGKVGFIGASYPGSEAHIAAIANSSYLGGVIPVVASTSFYHYHHKGGVPYGNHLTTNTGYNAFASAPTLNPQNENWATRQARELAECDQATHLTVQLDQTGAYTPWWADRNLRGRVGEVRVPVLMAQGLADWNVKPDHIARYWNDLAVRKTLVAGQWGHQFPEDADDAYGAWWELAAAFFDETLKGVDTGLFGEDRAYVEGTDGEWRTYGTWPPVDARRLAMNLTTGGLSTSEAPSGELSWDANPATGLALAASPIDPPMPAGEQVILEMTLDAPLHVSGVPLVNLTIVSGADDVHLVAILYRLDGDAWVRENYGYLNPIYRNGIDAPERLVPGVPTPVTIEMYPQEDVLEAGTTIALVLRSVDGDAVPVFDRTSVTVQLDGERPAQLLLPLSPSSS